MRLCRGLRGLTRPGHEQDASRQHTAVHSSRKAASSTQQRPAAHRLQRERLEFELRREQRVVHKAVAHHRPELGPRERVRLGRHVLLGVLPLAVGAAPRDRVAVEVAVVKAERRDRLQLPNRLSIEKVWSCWCMGMAHRRRETSSSRKAAQSAQPQNKQQRLSHPVHHDADLLLAVDDAAHLAPREYVAPALLPARAWSPARRVRRCDCMVIITEVAVCGWLLSAGKLRARKLRQRDDRARADAARRRARRRAVAHLWAPLPVQTAAAWYKRAYLQ